MEFAKVRINVVSDIDEEIWTSQLPNLEESIFQVCFTRIPIDTDIYVIYGKYVEGYFDVNLENLIFICAEPKEIQKYSLKYLKQFGAVYSANVSPYNKLSSFKPSHPYHPWLIGLVNQDGKVLVRRNWQSLSCVQELRDDRISVITSDKILTKMQKKRLKFIRFLELELGEELIVYGRERNFLADKGAGLDRHKFHLALENNISRNYWTEKLADPILMKNTIFYVGCPNIEEYFDTQVIECLDLDDFNRALKIIKERMGRLITDQDKKVLEANKQILMREHSIYGLLVDLAANYRRINSEDMGITLRLHYVSRYLIRYSNVIRSLYIYKIFNPIYKFLNN